MERQEVSKTESYPPHIIEQLLVHSLPEAMEGEPLSGRVIRQIESRMSDFFLGESGSEMKSRLRTYEGDDLGLISKMLGEWVIERYGSANSFEEAVREQTQEREEIEPLNSLLNFGVHEDRLHLHVYPAGSLGTREQLGQLRDGFQKLAERLKDKDLEHIQIIEGISWIVEKNPRLLEHLGFVIDRDEDGEMWTDGHGNARATISRENFLTKWGE
jgi:hypothetical protein